MARINIEDSIFKDGRFQDLSIAMGSRHAALGAVVEAFIIAQQFYLNSETNRMIPINEWRRRKASDLIIDHGLAEIRGEYIYVCGSEAQFAWLLQASNAGKSKSMKKMESLKNARNMRKNSSKPLNGTERTLNGTEALTPTLTLTLTQSHTQPHTLSKKSISTVVEKTTPVATDSSRSGLILFDNERELIGAIPERTKARWSELYPDEPFIHREVLKAFNWCENNAKRKPKTMRGWVQFLSIWFERGWPKHQKEIKAAVPSGFSQSEFEAMIEGKIR